MTNKSKTASHKSKKTVRAKSGTNAIDVLKRDHALVKNIFSEFRKLAKSSDASDVEKEAMVVAACHALKVHAQIEEEILYPALRETIKEQELLDEAEVEHGCAMQLIAELEDMAPSDRLFDAKFIVLGEQVKHHIEEEESAIFPKLRASGLDLDALGAALLRRKEDLESVLPPDNPLSFLFNNGHPGLSRVYHS